MQKPHAILIEGAEGAGKSTIASYLAAKVLNIEPSKLANYPYFKQIQPDGSISIETVRGLHEFAKLRTLGAAQIRRIIIMENASQMTREAQNAFLKLLEEPPADTMIILTVVSAHNLLPTIVSRVTKLPIQKPAKEVLFNYFKGQGASLTDIERAYALSSGQPSLMASLLDSSSEQPLVKQIQVAKELLGSTAFVRLTRVDELAKNKQDLPVLTTALKKVVQAALNAAIDRSKTDDAKRWTRTLRGLNTKESELAYSPNIKLWLTDLLISL